MLERFRNGLSVGGNKQKKKLSSSVSTDTHTKRHLHAHTERYEMKITDCVSFRYIKYTENCELFAHFK